MSQSVVAQVTALQGASLQKLRERWKALFGSEAPKRYKRPDLVKRLAYRIQEIALGGLSQDRRKQLEEIAAGESGRKRRNGAAPPIGTRLAREWEGERHEVNVTKEGFEYRGKPYKSLSAIARSITGTRWNGPAFFGLRKQRKG